MNEGKKDNVVVLPATEKAKERITWTCTNAIEPLIDFIKRSHEVDSAQRDRYCENIADIVETAFEEMGALDDWKMEHFTSLFAMDMEHVINVLAGDVLRGEISSELYDQFIEQTLRVLRQPPLQATAEEVNFIEHTKRKVTVDGIGPS
ncbi:MAG: hypothetical protein Q8P16_02200 [bacterium]|nr:hypothetical protein [bacterium]